MLLNHTECGLSDLEKSHWQATTGCVSPVDWLPPCMLESACCAFVAELFHFISLWGEVTSLLLSSPPPNLDKPPCLISLRIGLKICHLADQLTSLLGHDPCVLDHLLLSLLGALGCPWGWESYSCLEHMAVSHLPNPPQDPLNPSSLHPGSLALETFMCLCAWTWSPHCKLLTLMY